MLVAARAESLVARAGQHHYAHFGSIAAIIKSIENLLVCERTESIVHLRAVDCDFSYSLIEIEKYVGIVFDFSPDAFHIS